jgi:hypothetical protein
LLGVSQAGWIMPLAAVRAKDPLRRLSWSGNLAVMDAPNGREQRIL